MDFIDLKSQQKRILPSLNAKWKAILGHGKYILGPELTEMEGRLAEFVGVRHCLGVASGTDALLMALMVYDVKPGDEVITADFGFYAAAEMTALIGARPVFVDIDPKTYNMNPDLLERAISPKTRAIIPVNLYGQCADMEAISKIAERHGIPVIEDAAQSLGGSYRGRPSGGLSAIGCTSFYPAKPLGCYGDGGALFTDDDALAAQLKVLRVHGDEGGYRHVRVGINGRMDSVQAAVILAKLEIFPDELLARKRIGARYSELLSSVVQTPHIENNNESAYAQYTIRVPDRSSFQSNLHEKGIPTAIHYPTPLHLLPAFSHLGYRNGNFPESEKAAREVISLPMHPYLTETDQDRIIAAVRSSIS